MSAIAIIGGSGLKTFPALANIETCSGATDYGDTSAAPLQGAIAGKDGAMQDIYFLSRHGVGAHIPPHRINYRANIAALKQLGVRQLLSVNIVGGIPDAMGAGALVVPDQVLDYSWGRAHTFYDEAAAEIDHIDFTRPFTPALRQALLAAAKSGSVSCHDGGVYACTQGPRLETAAEVDRIERDGGDIIGMTVMPEAALAREAGLEYGAICLVVNAAAGRESGAITLADIQRVVEDKMAEVCSLLAVAVQTLR